MAEFINKELDVRFTVPDELTVRQQLQFKARVYRGAQVSDDMYIRYWEGAVGLIQDWSGAEKNGKGYKESKTLPDPFEVDLDKETSHRVGDVLFWVGTTIAGHMYNLDNIEKN